MRFKKLILFFLLFLLQSCSNSSRGVLRIGVDADWYPLDFGSQTAYVNGFTEDLLLELSRYTGVEFERIDANWDTIFDGLREKKYDAILTSMNPYEYNKAKNDFSVSFLDLGPVLVIPKAAKEKKIGELKGERVGILANSSSALILEKQPQILIGTFASIPDLLNAVVEGQIEAALLDRIPAARYVSDLYFEQLKIVGEPLTDAGLRIAAPKGKKHVHTVNRGLESIRSQKTFQRLLKKWQLTT